MMKTFTKLISGALALGMLAAPALTAFAATDTEGTATASPDTSISASVLAQATSDKTHFLFGEKSDFSGEKREIIELTDEQKAERLAKIQEMLARQLADGKMTQEQYDEAMSDLAEGKMTMMFRGEQGECEKIELTDEQKAERMTKLQEMLAEKLADGKITQEQHDQALTDLADGKMTMIFHGDRGEREKVELTDEQKAERVTKLQEILAQKLANGKITQDEYDQAMTALEEGTMPVKFRGNREEK